jgi:hypothetical protein
MKSRHDCGMAKGKHRRPKARDLIRAVANTSVAATRRVRAERRAYAVMPKPVPWDWAEPRLIPLICGPFFDRPGEELIRSVLPPGAAVAFGIDLGHGVLPYVDVVVAERWECTPGQICAAALDNLERRASLIPTTALKSGTLSGHIVQLLDSPRGWSTSVLLTPVHLKRLLGEHDQILLAAGHGTLISMPMDAPAHVARELVYEYEAKERYPLLLDPFALVGGEITWGGSTEYAGDGGDDDDWEPAYVQIS